MATGRFRDQLVKEWIYYLLDESERYLAELQTMYYNVKTKSDLIKLAHEMDYYKIKDNVYLIIKPQI